MKCRIEVTSREFKSVKDEVVDLNIADRKSLVELGRSLKKDNWTAKISVEVEYKKDWAVLVLFMANDNVEFSKPWMEVNGKDI